MDRVGRGSGSLSLAVRAQQEGPGGKQRGRERVRCELCSHGRYSDGEDDRFTNGSPGNFEFITDRSPGIYKEALFLIKI